MSQTTSLTPRKALNKAYLKIKPTRTQIESFKRNLIELMDGINEVESEEFHKNLVSHFLKNTYYLDRFFINTKEREDMAIYNGKDANSPVGVIIEAKKPSNKGDMITKDKLNKKALHELILYYLRERIAGNNQEVKQLVITNIYEWFIFDATVFDKYFAHNKTLVHLFNEFEAKRLSGTTTDIFYSEIAAPEVDKIADQLSYTYFDLRDIEKIARSNQKGKDTKLIPYYKIFSPEHLLKLSFTNDSNSLDRKFYNELLHIIGLEETKEKSKKLIGRKKEEKRDAGSLLENAMTILRYEDHLSNIKRSEYGSEKEEQLYHVALELVITWINRVLFLKLLEGQLIQYHQGDESYRFLNSKYIPNYDELNRLFFQVLAIKEEERNERVQQKYAHVPYLNSSLFDTNELERKTIRISNLEDDFSLPVLNSTVLKDRSGKRITGKKNALHYLFDFLDAYDFSSEGAEDIQEESKTLINASVLGLIFEKINGYKDGSFFTPGFITMYMCRETIRRAAVQKFNESWNWNCQSFDELKEDLVHEIRTSEKGRDAVRADANTIINSLHICDPAVGSGHFLVSALNELIAIKSELNILTDREGKSLNSYTIDIANDELAVTDIDGELFEYHPGNKESERMQKALFHEKQTLIENCLFGVDINPNSVKICRLRLWIELLKNAYYRDQTHLETLPNIDINIKCGNSLISRYALDADIKKALKKSKWTIDSYRLAVQTYREASNKDEKREMSRLIDTIKNDFESEIERNDKRVIRLNKLKGELFGLTNQQGLFEMNKTQQRSHNKKVRDLTTKVKKLETELNEIKHNQIYNNAFEWRFEFPEVLNDKGEFIGFDVVIGNPPYGVTLNKSEDDLYRKIYKVASYQIDTFTIFTELGNELLKEKGGLVFIIPNTWFSSIYDDKFRQYLFENNFIDAITDCPKNTFEEAVVETSIIHASKDETDNDLRIYTLDRIEINKIKKDIIKSDQNYCFEIHSKNQELLLLNKLKNKFSSVEDFFDVVWGIKVYQKGKGIPPQTGSESQNKVFHSITKNDSSYKPLIGGKEILPYLIRWEGGFIRYGEWLAEPRTPDWFVLRPRIVVREITAKGRIYASYIEDEFVFSNSVDGIRSKNNDKNQLLQLLGILNSMFASYYHLKTSSNSQKNTFPKVLVKNLRSFPFPQYSNKMLVDKVHQILSLKTESKDADTTILESEIDLMVYKLYNLSWEEVKLVDPEFEMGKEAYENYTIE